jgi:hypothetical protein
MLSGRIIAGFALLAIIVATASAQSPTKPAPGRTDLPPLFVKLNLAAEQDRSLVKRFQELQAKLATLPKDESWETEDKQIELERAYIDACWQLLRPEQQTAWVATANAQLLLVPHPDWHKLSFTDAQLASILRTSVAYRSHIPPAEQESKRLQQRVDTLGKQLKKTATIFDKKFEMMTVEREKLAASLQGAELRASRLRSHLRDDLQPVLTDEQRLRLEVLEARRLMPEEYARLRLSDEQIGRVAVDINRLVPLLRDLNEKGEIVHRKRERIEIFWKHSVVMKNGEIHIKATGVDAIELDNAYEDLVAAEKSLIEQIQTATAELTDAMNAVLTPEQKKRMAAN